MLDILQSENFILLASIVFLLGVGLVIGTIVFKRIKDEREVLNRLKGGNNYDTYEVASDDTGLLEKFGSHLTLPDAKEISKIRFQLAQAGYYLSLIHISEPTRPY